MRATTATCSPGSALDTGGAELGRIHAGENGNGKELRWIGQAGEGFLRRGQHCRASGRVHCEHARAKGSCGTHCSGHGIGNVMELEVEKDGMTARNDRFKHSGSCSDEQLKPHFEPMTGSLEPIHEGAGGFGVGHIERDNEPFAGLLQRVRSFRAVSGAGRIQEIRYGHNQIL